MCVCVYVGGGGDTLQPSEEFSNVFCYMRQGVVGHSMSRC